MNHQLCFHTLLSLSEFLKSRFKVRKRQQQQTGSAEKHAVESEDFLMTAVFGESPALSTLITLEVTKNNTGETFTCCCERNTWRGYHARVIFLAYEAYQAGTEENSDR